MQRSVTGLWKPKLGVGHLDWDKPPSQMTHVPFQFHSSVCLYNRKNWCGNSTPNWSNCQPGNWLFIQGRWKLVGLLCPLAPPVGSKPWKEDWGDVDEDGGHLYDQVKMLYEEGYESSLVFTQGIEDTIPVMSNLSPFYIQHAFSTPQTVWFCI